MKFEIRLFNKEGNELKLENETRDLWREKP